MKEQTKTFGPVFYTEDGQQYGITAIVRFTDYLSITGEIKCRSGGWYRVESCGQLHKEIAKHFPELAPYIKWHLISTSGPMHYVANTLYWLGYSGYCDGKPNSPPNLEHARATAVWPDMPERFLSTANGNDGGKGYVIQQLHERLPALMQDFKRDVESLGFSYV